MAVSLPYFHQFQEHLAQIRAHLSGETKDVLPSSFIAPATYWTSSEKNAFFHALARYSRLNPDLIAAHVKTKSVVDVCVYIEQLEAASRTNPIPWNRTQQDIAFEMSEEWIGFEEQSADALSAAEPMWHDEQRKAMRQAELNNKCKELGTDAFDSWRQESEAQWKREDLLEHLDTLKLNIMESILRTGTPVSQPPVADNDLASAVPDPALSNVTSGLETLHNGNIDTTLHSSSVDSVSPTGVTERHCLDTCSGGDNPTGPAHLSNQGVVAPATAPHQLTPNDPSTEVAYESLSLEDRRRLKRRLYMRRKRAEKSGADVDYTTAKLRVGRKPQENKQTVTPEKSTARRYVRDKVKTYRRKTTDHLECGSRYAYKRRRWLSECQIDFAVLQQSGLDLFHPSTLSQLIQIYKSGCTNEEQSTITSISADSIRLLRSVATSFISEVMHRAIVFKNQEIQIKGDIKVWGRGQKEISSETIRTCLEMMGLSDLTKNPVFEQLLPCQPGLEAEENDGSTLLEHETLSGCHLLSFLLGLDGTGMEDDPLSDTDDEGFWMMMNEERELDTRDKEKERQHEATLWKDVT